MSSILVLCTLRFTSELLERLRVVSPRLVVLQETCRTPDQVAEALGRHPDVEVLYTFNAPHNLLDLAPRLRWVQLHTAGADHLVGHPLLDSELAVTTSSGIHATPIAEYVMASLLAHRWQVPGWTRCQREASWPSNRWNQFSRPELRDSTLGIVGYGSIGREVGRLARAFGMHVLAMRRSAGPVEDGYAVPDTGDPQGTIPDRYFPPEALHAMLAECDYVVLALPLTPATRHIIGEAELHAMKHTAYLVNIARGGLVDEQALVRALRERWIAGAGLDVFEREPLPDDSPLWEMENALISPHVAGFTPLYDERAAELFAANLRRYLAGEPLLNRIDASRGY